MHATVETGGYGLGAARLLERGKPTPAERPRCQRSNGIGIIPTMNTIHEIKDFLDQFAPPRLAEEWDNVGLLVGDPAQRASRIMTCLTVTPTSAAEAIREGAELIVTHHPLPFRALKRVTTETIAGKLLWDLMNAKIAIFSPHTAFDSAQEGINQQLAEGLGLEDISYLQSHIDDPDGLGSGRQGTYRSAITLQEAIEKLKQFLMIDRLTYVGDMDQPVNLVAVACGSAGQFLELTKTCGCDVLVTGETNFHTCLEAESMGIALLMPGHYASERFAVERLAKRIGTHFTDCEVWASRDESDPIHWC